MLCTASTTLWLLGGVLHSKDGTAKFLRPEDMAERMASGLDEFDAAIAAHKAKDPVAIPQCKCLGCT